MGRGAGRRSGADRRSGDAHPPGRKLLQKGAQRHQRKENAAQPIFLGV